jgi:hypothetical protein
MRTNQDPHSLSMLGDTESKDTLSSSQCKEKQKSNPKNLDDVRTR